VTTPICLPPVVSWPSGFLVVPPLLSYMVCPLKSVVYFFNVWFFFLFLISGTADSFLSALRPGEFTALLLGSPSA